MTATVALATDDASRPGAPCVESRYRLLNILRDCPSGVVWGAIDERLNRRVAVHQLSVAGWASEPGEFGRHVGTLARLNHVGIVRLFDANPYAEITGQASGPILVTELADGPTLAQRLATGSMDGSSALQLAIDLAGALVYLHASGVTGSRIDPHHVLMCSTLPGATCVPPREWDDGPTAKLSIDGLGMPGLIAADEAGGPERDVYSLGVTMDAVVPFRRRSAEWDDLLSWMLDPDPRGRPSATALCRALAEFGSDAQSIVPWDEETDGPDALLSERRNRARHRARAL